MTVLKEGDWVVFDMKIGQIKELRENGNASFTDGHCVTSGQIAGRFRPLTLRNKQIADWLDDAYRRLRKIDGEAGFNYPDISTYFSDLALQAMDATEDQSQQFFDRANEFLVDAQSYVPRIQGVSLFRRASRVG